MGFEGISRGIKGEVSELNGILVHSSFLLIFSIQGRVSERDGEGLKKENL